MSGTALDRNAIIIGLRDLVTELRNSGEVAGIRLVGGAALAVAERGSATSATGHSATGQM